MKFLIRLFVLCIPGIITATPFSFDEVKQVTVGFQEVMPEFVQANDGLSLAYYSFVPDSPKAAIVFYHGSGVWSNSMYQHMAQQASEQHNLAVYLFDVRGHGNSEGERGDAPSDMQVWHDVRTAIKFVKAKHGNSPLFFAGHSSGAGLVLNYSAWNKEEDGVDGYILLAPYLGARVGVEREHKNPEEKFIKDMHLFPLIVHAVTGLCAHWVALDFNYPEWLYAQDKHILKTYTCAMTSAISPNDPKAIFVGLKKPCALFIGEDDELFIPKEVVKYVNYMTSCKESSVGEIMPKLKHLSILCQGHELLNRAVESWFNKN